MRKSPRSASAAMRRAERREVDDLRADVDVQALEVELVGGHDTLDRGRRCVEVEAELRVRAAGRDRRVRVGADARGRSASARRWRSPGATISSSRSMSRMLSSTTWPTPASWASSSSRHDFALPCRWMRPGSKPALSAMCSSPPPATSHASPSSAISRMTAVHANALEAKWTSKSSVRAANAARNARTRARMSSTATISAGVPNSRARSSGVAAADLEAAVVCQAAAERVGGRGLLDGGGHCGVA